jgi:hypothetical protein
MDLLNLINLTPSRRDGDRRGPARDLQERNREPGLGDPTIAALLRLVGAQRAGAEATPAAAFGGDAAIGWTAEEVDELTDRLDASVRDARRLRTELDRAQGELRQLRDQTRRLAAALGACHACWGEDSGCADCQGCGRPGRSGPDEILFAEMVMPAVRLMRQWDSRSSPQRTEPAASRSRSEPAVVNRYAHALAGTPHR